MGTAVGDVGEHVGVAVSNCDGENVGSLLGKVVGITVGSVREDVGDEVGFVVYIFTKPAPLLLPRRFKNIVPLE